MALRYLLFALLTFNYSLAYGNNLLSVDNHLIVESLGSKVKVLAEDSPEINFNNLSADIHKFNWKNTTEDPPNLGFSLPPHWFWVELSNDTPQSISALLHIYFPLLDYIDVYHIKGDVLHQWHTGDRLPFDSRPIEHPNFIFPLEIDGLETSTLLIRIENAGAMQAPMQLWDEKEFFKRVQKHSIPHGIFIGLFLVLILYNFFLYLSTRDLSYLYYVVFASSFLLFSMSIIGYGFQYLWSEAIEFQQFSAYIFICLSLIGMVEFTIKFLVIPATKNKAFLFLRSLTLAAILCLIFLYFLPYRCMVQALLSVCIYASAISIFVGLYKIKQMGITALLYASAWIIMAIGITLSVLNKFAVIPVNYFTEMAAAGSFIIFSLFLSFALGYRIEEERKNRIIAEKNVIISKNDTLQAQLKTSELEYQSEQLKIKSEAEIQAKNKFLAMMSHEIRTPLNGIMGLSHLLKASHLDNKQQQYVDTIFSSGESLLIIINDILDYSKILAGKLDIEAIPVNIFELTRNCTSIISNELQEKDINLYVSVSPATPFVVKADPVRLRQVILNYLSNAIKFSNNKDIELNISLNPTNNELEINVFDQGIGISSDKQKELFSAFSQADSSTTRKYGGSGLGLAICKQLAILTGGDVGVESEEGKGSHFWFTCKIAIIDLPLQDYSFDNKKYYLALMDYESDFKFISSQMSLWNCHVHSISEADPSLQYSGLFINHNAINTPKVKNLYKVFKLDKKHTFGIGGFDEPSQLCRPLSVNALYDIAHKDTSESVEQSDSSLDKDTVNVSCPLNGLRILIAEDNHVNQLVITAMIKKFGAEFTLVENGQQAVNQMIDNPHGYDIVLMDCEMPIMDGFTASNLINQSITDAPPIIALTAHAMEQHKKQAESAGMRGFISKPIDQKTLLAVIQKSLNTPS